MRANVSHAARFLYYREIMGNSAFDIDDFSFYNKAWEHKTSISNRFNSEMGCKSCFSTKSEIVDICTEENWLISQDSKGRGFLHYIDSDLPSLMITKTSQHLLKLVTNGDLIILVLKQKINGSLVLNFFEKEKLRSGELKQVKELVIPEVKAHHIECIDSINLLAVIRNSDFFEVLSIESGKVVTSIALSSCYSLYYSRGSIFLVKSKENGVQVLMKSLVSSQVANFFVQGGVTPEFIDMVGTDLVLSMKDRSLLKYNFSTLEFSNLECVSPRNYYMLEKESVVLEDKRTYLASNFSESLSIQAHDIVMAESEDMILGYENKTQQLHFISVSKLESFSIRVPTRSRVTSIAFNFESQFVILGMKNSTIKILH